MAFPVSALRPVGGSAYAHLFENPRVGVNRDLFWSFTINFAAVPLGSDADEFSPSLTVEWVRFPIRDWQQVKGVSVSGAYGDAGVESTFYVFEHSYAEQFALSVLQWRTVHRAPDPRPHIQLLLQVELTVNYPGYDDDADPNLSVGAECWVDFTGVSVRPDALTPKPEGPEETRRILEPFISTNSLVAPETDGTWWRPRVVA